MMFRKLFLVFAVVAGLCAFDGPVESPRLLQVAQTEIVVAGPEQKQVAAAAKAKLSHPLFFVYNDAAPVSFYHHYHHSLLIESQQHRASL